jgi:hypothetical protein
MKSSDKVKLFGMGLAAALVSFLITSNGTVSWAKIMMLFLLAIGLILYSFLTSRKDSKEVLQLRDLDNYRNDVAELDLDERGSDYDEDDFV